MSSEPAYTDAEIDALGLCRERLARHIAIIMDGNGRWAQQRGFPRIEGHRNGVHSVRAIVEECSRLGLDQLTLYCFSSENSMIFQEPAKREQCFHAISESVRD